VSTQWDPRTFLRYNKMSTQWDPRTFLRYNKVSTQWDPRTFLRYNKVSIQWNPRTFLRYNEVSTEWDPRTFLRYNYVSTQWDPILYWPEDDRLWLKHVAVMWPDCIYYITVLIYCCVLTADNTLYKFVTVQRDGLCQTQNTQSTVKYKSQYLENVVINNAYRLYQFICF